MKKRMNIDNPFFAFMGRLADIVIVNLLFILCSLPVITAGASIAAMYQTIKEMRGENFVSSFYSFTRAFRRILKKSILLWILELVSGGVLVFDLMFVAGAGNTIFWRVSGMVLGSIFFIWNLLFCFLFPAGVFAGRNWKDAIFRSLYLAVRNFPYALGMVVLNLIPGICIVLGEAFIGLVTPIYLAVGFGLTAYLNTMLLERCKEVEEK
ncbi:MAG: DUF624 domain-containing protein [Dorea sp.]